jgi:hypothetical protein
MLGQKKRVRLFCGNQKFFDNRQIFLKGIGFRVIVCGIFLEQTDILTIFANMETRAPRVSR